MIRFPILTHLHVSGYGLFPGDDGNGIDRVIDSGLMLIAGVNGLGKTTLLTMLLRTLTGPFDLTSDGSPHRLDAVLPAAPVALGSRAIRFFAQRVADGAAQAFCQVTATFGPVTIVIRRRLNDLELTTLLVDGKAFTLPSRKIDREALFQSHLCQLFGLSSFVDVLLVLHHVVFFQEDRPGALWDENAQRQLLRALLLESSVAAQVAELERLVQSSDSLARNISARAYNIAKELADAEQRETVSPQIKAELAAEQKILDADLARQRALEQKLSDVDDARKAARLEHEKAKLEREEADSAVERLKYTALLQLFPKMEDAARLIFLRIVTTGECLLCGADASIRRQELEDLLARGDCPACGAEPMEQAHPTTTHDVDQKKIDRSRARADLATKEEEATRLRLGQLIAEYEEVLGAITVVRRSIDERLRNEKRLRALLPEPSITVSDLRRALEATRRSQRQAEATRAAYSRDLQALLQTTQGRIVRKAKQLSTSFNTHTTKLLADTASLVRVSGSARLTQGKSDFSVPAFLPEMAAANRPGLLRRESPKDVSESQLELMDLAFRLSLVEVTTSNAPCSFIMETPEASLDEIAMQRVGNSLANFASRAGNRLIVTSNLTNTGMITAMFGGPTKSKREIARRASHVVDLLKIAAPNAAVERDGERYARILQNAISGVAQ